MTASMNADRISWIWALLTLALVWAVLIILLEPSGSSMVKVWDSSETFTHGYVILPIALWLVWRRRHDVMASPLRPDPWALAPALGLSGMWLAGRMVGAQVVEHYALVGLLSVAVWALYGRSVVRQLFFPLWFLLLMVPAGDSLIEPMIAFTADFTVNVVRMLGIPVYQEGTFFVLPSGEWSVVEACSGFRYFLSSIVLGWLFAYLTYRTWWKRLAFGLASIIVPIIANGFRAVIIVLLGHYSGMTLAVGVDHLIYGWIWFGVVMLILFWLGSIWREDNPAPAAPKTETAAAARPALLMALILTGSVGLFTLYEHRISTAPPAASPLADWVAGKTWLEQTKPITQWRPRWQGMDDQRVVHLTRTGDQLMLYLAWYGAQRQNAELINSQNVLVAEKDADWRNLKETTERIDMEGEALSVRQAKLHAPKTGERLLVWHWRHLDGVDDVNIFRGKLRLAWSKLMGRGDAAAGILIAAPYIDRPEEAVPVLKAFFKNARPDLNLVLDKRGMTP